MYLFILGIFFSALCFMGCNTIVITHTQGTASDVVDSTPTTETKIDAEVSPDLKLPGKQD